MERYFLPFHRLDSWLGRLMGYYTVFLPAVIENQVHWHRLTPDDLADKSLEWGLGHIRASEPIKGFFFSPREKVASFPEKFEPEDQKKRILFGVKACDLSALKVQQKMFLEGNFRDPFYDARLKNTILIAADCSEPEDTCFCNLMGNKPYATEGADMTLSVLDEGYLFEVMTGRGNELIDLGGDAFGPVTDAQVARRDENHKAAVDKLNRINPRSWNPDLAKAIEGKIQDEAFWRRHAESCVECYGCLLACPTCFCFLLYDEAKQTGVERTKVWDACYMAAYARVGGGANPKAEFLKRFMNRFFCKFVHFKNEHGFYACTGCGRCIKGCMGKIDIRKVLAEL